MAQLVLLFFLASLLLGANAFRHLSGIDGLNYQPKSEIKPGVYKHEFEETDFLGGTTFFSFNAKTMANIIPLDRLPGIKNLTCSESNLIVSFEEASISGHFKIGHIITASAKYGCVDEKGQNVPIYRQIEHINYMQNDNTLVIETQTKTFIDCFQKAHFKLIYKPSPYAAELIEALSSVNFTDPDIRLDEEETTGNQRKLKGIGSIIKKIGKGIGDTIGKGVNVIGNIAKKITKELENILKIDINGVFDKQMGLFNFNYNPTTGGATKTYNILNKTWKGNNFVTVDCTSCYAYLVAGIHVEVKIGLDKLILPRLKYFRGSAFGDFKMNADITARGNFEFQKLINDLPILNIGLGSIQFMIGPVPVVIIPSIGLDAKVEFTAGASGTASIGFDFRKKVEFGVEYKDTKFMSIKPDNINEFNAHPLQYTFQGKSNLKVWLIPSIELSLYGIVPIGFELDPYIGVDAITGKCGNTFTPFYQLFYGLDFSLGLNSLKFGSGALEMIFTQPYHFEGTLIGKKNLGCSWCSGCIKLATTPAIAAQTLSVYTVLDEADVNNDITCAQQTSCSSCLSVSTCGWCDTSKTCSPGTLSGPDTGYCPLDIGWYIEDCIPYEKPIVVTSPVNGSLLSAGNSYNITWTGGKVGGLVSIALLRWDLDNLYFGAGLPLDPIPNTGSYSWTVQSGIEANYWQVAILSESDAINANFSGKFYLDSTYKPGMPINYYWYASLWSECSKQCDGGIKTRDLYCLNSLGDGFEEGNCSTPYPTVQLLCRTKPCPDVPLKLFTPKFDISYQVGQTVDITWAGGKLYGQIYIRFITAEERSIWKAGYGIPASSVMNTGSYQWVIADDFPLSNGVQMIIFSESLYTTNSNTVAFGDFYILKNVSYTITLPKLAPNDIEIQLVGIIGSSPIISIPAGQNKITTTFLYIGSVISVGINDKNKITTSFSANEVTVSYGSEEQVIAGEKVLENPPPVLGTTQIAILVCGIVAFIAIVGAIAALVVKRRRASKTGRNDKYSPLIQD